MEHTLELHLRGETPSQSSFRVLQAANELGLQGLLQAANELGLQGWKIVGMRGNYCLGDLQMDVVIQREGEAPMALNREGDSLEPVEPV